jgi:hypothetical protein
MCIDYVLDLWLKDVPDNTNEFCTWVLLYSLVNSLNNPIWSLALAIGKLKNYILIGSGVFLMTFPIAYLALRLGCPPVSVFVISLIVRLLYIIVVLAIIKHYITFSLTAYVQEVVLPSVLVVVPSGLLCLVLQPYIDGSLCGLITMITLSTIAICILIWLCGIRKDERIYVKSFAKAKFRTK